MMLACLALSAWPQSAPLDQEVSFSSEARRAPALIERLATISKVPMAVAPDLTNDVLIVDVKKVSLMELMDRIAAVSLSKWRLQGLTYRLVRSPALVSKAEASELETKTQELRASIAAQSKVVGPEMDEAQAVSLIKQAEAMSKLSADGGEESGQPLSLAARTPAGHLFARALGMLPADDIARMDQEQRRVYSNAPTAMQRKFTGSLDLAIAEFVREFGLWSDVLKRTRNRDANVHGLAFDLGGRSIVLPLRVQLVVLGPGSTVTMKIIDAAGTQFADSITTLRRSRKFVPPDTTNPAPGEPIEFSNKARLALDHSKPGSGPHNTSHTKQLVAMASDPLTHDPLSFLASDLFVAVARGKGLNLVGLLDDGLENSLGPWAFNERTTVAAADQIIKANEDVETRTDGGWLIVQPRLPGSSIKYRGDRAALKELLVKAASGGLTLEDRARYSLSQSRPEYALSYFTLGMAGLEEQALSGEFDLLRLYGSLSPEQRRALERGTSLDFSSLNSIQRGFLERVLYFSKSNLYSARPAPGPGVRYSEKFFQELREPTDLLPNGIPAQGSLRLRIEQQDAVHAITSSGASCLVDEPESLGRILEDQRSSEDPMSRFQQAARKRYLFVFDVRPDAYLEMEQTDDRIGNSPPGPLSSLPATLRDAIEKSAAVTRKIRERMPDRQGKGPPPPK